MDTLYTDTVTALIEQEDFVQLVGYDDHKKTIYKNYVRLFLVMHMHFIIKRINYTGIKVKREKTRKY